MTMEATIPLRVGIHDLTYDQRAVWGTCPVCRAKHGELCRLYAEGAHKWTHSERIQQAPQRVRIEALP
jgi:hypothetical protein